MTKHLAALALLMAITSVGCSGSHMTAQLPQYVAAPTNEASRLFVRVRIADEPEVNQLLSQVVDSITIRNWRLLAHTLDPVGYAEQFAFMKAGSEARSDADVVAQILRETLGLGMVDNNLSGTVGTYNQPFARLNRIQQVELTGVDPPGNEFRQVDGIVTLEDGSTRSLSFSVMMGSDGEWLIVVPMG